MPIPEGPNAGASSVRPERLFRPLQGLDAGDGEPYFHTTFKLHETVNVSLPQHGLLFYYESCPPALAHRRRALPGAPEGYVLTEHFDVTVTWKRDATHITVGVCSHLWRKDDNAIRCLLPSVFVTAFPIVTAGLFVRTHMPQWLDCQHCLDTFCAHSEGAGSLGWLKSKPWRRRSLPHRWGCVEAGRECALSSRPLGGLGGLRGGFSLPCTMADG